MNKIKLYLSRNIQIVYYWIFVVVLLVPNFIILDTSPQPFYMMIPYLLIPMSVYMLLLVLSRKPGYMLIFAFPFVFIGAFQMVLITLSNSTVIGADMFTNIFTTNTSEATDVLSTLLRTLFNLLILYGGAYTLSYFSIKNKIDRPARFYRKILIGAPVMFFVGLAFVFISYHKNPYYSFVQDVFPVNVVNNFRVSIQRWRMSKAYPETSKDFRFNATVAPKAQREVYILVVGESSRADRWELYGYDRGTTPQLEALGEQIISMSDAVTESNTTHKSTALIMSSVSAVDFEKVYKQKSIVSAFNEAGFKTLFISNQGANGSFMDFYASEATKRVDMPSRKAESGTVVGYDTETLSHIKEYIASTNDNILIVVHSYGSHL
ncbi:MAG: sulfatase-like hydrolase/transferase, partial [Rikenellaceae bacterium]